MEKQDVYICKAVFAKEEDGGYSVNFPDFDGCYTQGDTFAEAYKMAEDAISLHIYGMEADGKTIPEPWFSSEKEEGKEEVIITIRMDSFRKAMEKRA